MFVFPEKQGLFTDWNAHFAYFPIFLFGFALAGESKLWPTIARLQWPAAAVALIAGIIVVCIELAYEGHNVPPHLIMVPTPSTSNVVRRCQSWSNGATPRITAMAEVKALGGTGGVILTGPTGEMAWTFNTPGMRW